MRVRVSAHAVERFRQRGRQLTFKQASKELDRLVPLAEWHTLAPKWLRSSIKDYDGVLVLGDMALIVQDQVIVTCIYRGTISPHERERRKRRKRERRELLARRRGL